jgi:hypothetical protein
MWRVSCRGSERCVREASRHDELDFYGSPFQQDKEKMFDETLRSGLLAPINGLFRRPSGKYRLIPLEPLWTQSNSRKTSASRY